MFRNKTFPTIQTDYTTLMGAANALDLKEIEKNGFTITSLLNLSQFIETFVLNSKIQFEYGLSNEWEPYRKAFESKELGKYILKEKNIFNKVEVQVDEREDVVSSVIKEIIYSEINSNKLKSLDYITRFRNGTYSAIPNIQDQSNPVIERYLQIARDNFNNEEKIRLEEYIRKLKNGNIGILGLFVEARIKFIQKFLLTQTAIYNPHFSRQPLISNESNIDVHFWNMEQLSNFRNELLEDKDILGNELSPVFLACLSNAKYPMDILENAIRLRNSNYAKEYRTLCDKIILDLINGDSTKLVLYKNNMKRILKDLNEVILTNGITEVKKYQLELKTDIVPISGKYIIEKTEKINNGIGVKNFTMFTNVIRDSIGFVNTLEKLSEIYNQEFIFDTDILSNFTKKQ